MVWKCFASNGFGQICQVDGNVNKEKYEKILKNHIKPWAEKLFGKGNNFIFQHDNAPMHKAALVKKYLNKQSYQVMEWPVQSPDLNPIENLWHILDKTMVNREDTTTEELFITVKEAWNNLDKNIFINLVKSMPKSCQIVINNNGLPIKY